MQEKLWTKNFFALTLANGLLFSSFYFLMPTMPMFAADIGASGTEIGIVGGIFGYSAILIRLFTNNFSKNLGKKNCLYLGLFISICVTLSFLIFDSINNVIIARFIHGFGFGLSTTFAAAIVLNVIPSTRRGEGLGYFGLGSTVGMAIAPALGIFLYKNFGATTLFIFSAIFTFFSVLTVFFGDKNNSSDEKIKSSPHYDSFFDRILMSGTGRAAILTIFFSVAYGSVNTFIAMAADELKIDGAGLFFLIGTTFIFLSRPIGGRLFDNHGAFATILPGAISYTIALILIFLAKSKIFLIIAAIFHGIGAGLLLPALMTWMINCVKPEQRDAASATFYNMLDIGTATGVLFLGSLAGIIGYIEIYKFVAVIMLIFIASIFWIKFKIGFR